MNNFNDKNILITGATGLLCSSLAKWLLKNTTANIYALGRSRKKIEEIFSQEDQGRLHYIVQDVSSDIQIEENVDYIFHGAGPIDSATIQSRPLDVILPNIKGLLNCQKNMTEQMIRSGRASRLIVFSSATVYGDAIEERICKESDFLMTGNLQSASACYFEAKRMAEVLAQSMVKQYGIDAVIVRFSYVYGIAPFMPNTAFYQFINTLISGQNIIMNSSDLPKRDNIYLDDAVNGLLTVALKGKTGEVYNISSGGDKGGFAAIDEIAEIMTHYVNELGNHNLKLLYHQPSVSKRKPGIVLSNDKLKGLGWETETSIKEGIKMILDYYLRE